ncbi:MULTISPECIES: hypothetical protein [unclassified Agromyces]|uniref:hypothetical protein n=1 Tax=unclassified Agromyces TaxID=2639701 RepID=UPI0030153443
MLRRLQLPASRRSTFRAPDPEAAARFDLALPGANTDDDRRPAAELAQLADLRTESIATALVEQRRLVEERLVAEVTADRDVAASRVDREAREAPSPQVVRTSFVVAPSEDRARHPRHRADRIGNRRATSGARRTVLAG